MAKRNKYPGVYARWNKLWIRYREADGREVRVSTDLPLGKKREAFAILKEIKARLAAAQAVAREVDSDGPVTLAAYAKRWVERRKERGIASARDDGARFRLHINPHRINGLPFGVMPIADDEPLHIRDLVRDLVAEKDPAKRLAPRSIRNLYGMLHTTSTRAWSDSSSPIRASCRARRCRRSATRIRCGGRARTSRARRSSSWSPTSRFRGIVI